jgi:hypothetical protein
MVLAFLPVKKYTTLIIANCRRKFHRRLIFPQNSQNAHKRSQMPMNEIVSHETIAARITVRKSQVRRIARYRRVAGRRASPPAVVSGSRACVRRFAAAADIEAAQNVSCETF